MNVLLCGGRRTVSRELMSNLLGFHGRTSLILMEQRLACNLDFSRLPLTTDDIFAGKKQETFGKASAMYLGDSLQVGASVTYLMNEGLGWELGAFRTLNQTPSWIPMQPCLSLALRCTKGF